MIVTLCVINVKRYYSFLAKKAPHIRELWLAFATTTIGGASFFFIVTRG